MDRYASLQNTALGLGIPLIMTLTSHIKSFLMWVLLHFAADGSKTQNSLLLHAIRGVLKDKEDTNQNMLLTFS